MGNIFKGESWEKVAEHRARILAKVNGQPEELWELFLFDVNKSMMKEVKEDGGKE